MNILKIVLFAVIAASTVVHTDANAQAINDSFTYQGTLNDDGVPANGLYDFTFGIYQQAVAGSPIPDGFLSVPNVQVTDGLFSVWLDFGVRGSIFESTNTRWLNLRVRRAGVGGYATLNPRQPITPAPLANFAISADHSETAELAEFAQTAIYANASGTSLQDAYDNGATIKRDTGEPAVAIESVGTSSARLMLGSQTGTQSAGELSIFTPLGSNLFSVTRDISTGGGGFATLARNDEGSSGITMEGNFGGNESARLTIFGATNTINFNSFNPGDASVQLPIDAINSSEILNEVGVGEARFGGSTFLDTGVIEVIESVTLDCPADGYVLVLASSEVTVRHNESEPSFVKFGVSYADNDFLGGEDIFLSIPSNVLTGNFVYPVTVHTVIQVLAGPNTFYFLGLKQSPNDNFGVAVAEGQLSAIYIPTSYGIIIREADEINIPDGHESITPTLTQYDILIERNAALEANAQRQQREMDAMNAQVQRLIEQSNQQRQLQSQD